MAARRGYPDEILGIGMDFFPPEIPSQCVKAVGVLQNGLSDSLKLFLKQRRVCTDVDPRPPEIRRVHACASDSGVNLR